MIGRFRVFRAFFLLVLQFYLFTGVQAASGDFFTDWGPDKILHLLAGAIIGFNYCLLPFSSAEDAYLASILIDTAVVFGKELADSFTGGNVEIADIGAGLLPAVLVSTGLFALERYAAFRLRIGFDSQNLKIQANWTF